MLAEGGARVERAEATIDSTQGAGRGRLTGDWIATAIPSNGRIGRPTPGAPTATLAAPAGHPSARTVACVRNGSTSGVSTVAARSVDSRRGSAGVGVNQVVRTGRSC